MKFILKQFFGGHIIVSQIKIDRRAEKMAQSISPLSHEHESWDFIPSLPVKARSGTVHLYINTWEVDTGGSLGLAGQSV